MADFIAILAVAITALMIFAWFRVIKKMGYPGWYVVVFLVPLVGALVFLYFAFAEWPVERELAEYRLQVRIQDRDAAKVNI